MEEQKGKQSKGTLKDKAYVYLKGQIINGILKPGEIIDEKKYVSELQISRTPVHEALSCLVTENLVTIVPRRGIIVSYLRIKDVLDIYEVRKIIEPSVMALIGRKFDHAVLEKFQNDFINTAMISSTLEGLDLDSKFHLYLASCTGNKVLLEVEERMLTQSQRIRVLSSSYDKSHDTAAREEHCRIIQALLANDSATAGEIAVQHLDRSVARYNTIFTSGDFMV